jgi:hypothetical protein
MPINPATTLPIFTAALSANALIGKSAIQLATGLSLGLFQYVQAGLTVISIDAGTLGAGTGTGPGIILTPLTITPLLLASIGGHGMTGSYVPPLVDAISIAVSSSFAQAIVETINPLVGIGAGKLQLIPNGTGSAIFPAAFLESGLTGLMAANLGSAVGLALDSAVPSAIGVIAIIGSPSIISSVGTGIGRII